MKKGFTLAEVLITLTILGVIASITMPALNNNIWAAQRGPLLKTAYARLKNATDIAIQDLGYTPKCAYYRSGANPYYNELGVTVQITYDEEGNPTWSFYDKDGNPYDFKGKDVNGEYGDCKVLGDAILKNLRVTKTCSGTTNCKPEYNGNDTIYRSNNSSNWETSEGMTKEEIAEIEKQKNYDTNKATGGTSGFRKNSIANNYAFYTNNGFSIINYHSTNYFYPSLFMIDTNGIKGPNKWGQDVFAFQAEFGRSGKNIEFKPSSGSNYKEKHNGLNGESAEEILRNRK